MRVIRAEVMGMCFGVAMPWRSSSGSAIPGGPDPRSARAQRGGADDLRARGFAMRARPEPNRRAAAPTPKRVLITAHGISERERRRLETAGKGLIDATCPLVARVHQAAQSLQRRAIMCW